MWSFLMIVCGSLVYVYNTLVLVVKLGPIPGPSVFTEIYACARIKSYIAQKIVLFRHKGL